MYFHAGKLNECRRWQVSTKVNTADRREWRGGGGTSDREGRVQRRGAGLPQQVVDQLHLRLARLVQPLRQPLRPLILWVWMPRAGGGGGPNVAKGCLKKKCEGKGGEKKTKKHKFLKSKNTQAKILQKNCNLKKRICPVCNQCLHLVACIQSHNGPGQWGRQRQASGRIYIRFFFGWAFDGEEDIG